jgi:methionine-rich copper-binding protein CopC
MRSIWLAVGATLLLGLASPSPVLAHAVLTKTSLDGTSVRADTATTVTLSFNTAIEAGLTKVVLVDQRNEERVLELLAPEKPGQVRVAVPALTPGTYGLRYKVLAADGHVTENMLRFTVAAAD